MSTVQEIQEAISQLPENQLFELISWLHSQHDQDWENDPTIVASVREGERQLNAGKGISIEEVRKLTRTWTTK